MVILPRPHIQLFYRVFDELLNLSPTSENLFQIYHPLPTQCQQRA